MVKGMSFSLFAALILCPLSALAQAPFESKQLFSPSVGQKFFDIAYEMAQSETLTEAQTEQAILLSMATQELDSRASYVLPDMIKLLSRESKRDQSQMVFKLLTNYTDDSSNLEVIRRAVRYMLDRLNSREERESLLAMLLQNLGGANSTLDAELATLLGLLMAEKGDTEAAQYYFTIAYNNNRYNKLAFAKLVELIPDKLRPETYVEHLRLALGQNPLNLEAALAFAQYAEQIQLYQTASDAYEYCANLFAYQYQSHPLPAYIYLPWATNSYNTQRSQHRCLQIAESIRETGQFNLVLEAIAGKAAAKIGDEQQSNQILKTAEEKALQLVTDNLTEQQLMAQQLAWFYCFVLPDADNALSWANKAYSADTNSTTAAALLAYTLAINQQTDLVKSIVEAYQENSIADLAIAQIQLAQGQKEEAIKTLKSAIAKNPGALEAEYAAQILTQVGSEYIAPVSPDIILASLQNEFGQTLVPPFLTPNAIISFQLHVRGTKFSYGSEFNASVAITNNSSEPLIISDGGLFGGNIRIDAQITGDIDRNISNLVSAKIWPTLPVEPGQSFILPVRLATGELRDILWSYPQASLEIEFTAYLDPVIDERGKPSNRLADIQPARQVVKRPGVKLTTKYLQNKINSLSKGRQGQKIMAVELFIGLLTEQNAMAGREPLYEFMYTDWMPEMLKSSLLHALGDDDWVVKVHAMARAASLPLDYEMINVLAENLNDTDHWPVRMIALFLLANAQDENFKKVLDWSAKYDRHKLVRGMAVGLGGAMPEARQPVNQQNQNRPSTNEQPANRNK